MKNFRFLIVNIYILFLIINVSFSQNTLYDQAKALLNSTTPGDTIKFAVLADSHWFNEKQENQNMLLAILNSAKDNGANLIFICGDSYNHASDMELGFYSGDYQFQTQ